MANQFTAPIKKQSLPISIVLYGSHDINLMQSYPHKLYLEYKSVKIIDRILNEISGRFANYELLVCGGAKFDSIINKFTIIENVNFDTTGPCEDIRLALNLVQNKNVLLLNQATWFEELSLKLTYNHSFVLSTNDTDKHYVSINTEEKQVHSFSYNSNDLKWKDIVFIHNKDFDYYKSILDSRLFTKKLLFESLNKFVENRVMTNIQTDKEIVTINSPKHYRKLNAHLFTK